MRGTGLPVNGLVDRQAGARSGTTINTIMRRAYRRWPCVVQYQIPIIIVIRSRKAGPGWISYLRMSAFYTNFSITTPEFLIFLQISAFLLIAHFLIKLVIV